MFELQVSLFQMSIGLCFIRQGTSAPGEPHIVLINDENVEVEKVLIEKF